MPGQTPLGALRHRVWLERDAGEAKDGVDALGQPAERWERQFQAWAAVEPLAGREYWQAEQANAETTHRLTARWDRRWRAVAATWRVTWGGRVFHLTEPPRNAEERGREVMVMLKEAT